VIAAVVLDFDDTLCLTEAVSFELENEVLARIGRPPVPRAIHLHTWGQPLREAMANRSPGLDLDQFFAAYNPLLAEFVSDGRLDAIAPENLTALDELVASGHRLMLLTSRTGSEVAHMLEPDHCLAGRISATYHADNITHLKPDPRAFDVLLAASGLAPAECVYVGDSPSDAAAANGAGMHFVACMQSNVRTRADFAEHRVDAFIDAFPDVVEAVAGLADRG
jgi:phosphoglycolate phosphatase